jgi:hypothetical protein
MLATKSLSVKDVPHQMQSHGVDDSVILTLGRCGCELQVLKSIDTVPHSRKTLGTFP